jgi:hypothetical protein
VLLILPHGQHCSEDDRSMCVYILVWMCQFHREVCGADTMLHNIVFFQSNIKGKCCQTSVTNHI